jgi:hypothetical protein
MDRLRGFVQDDQSPNNYGCRAASTASQQLNPCLNKPAVRAVHYAACVDLRVAGFVKSTASPQSDDAKTRRSAGKAGQPKGSCQLTGITSAVIESLAVLDSGELTPQRVERRREE